MDRDASPPSGPLTTVLVTAGELDSGELRITGDAYRHLFRAKRLAAGELLRLCDGAGRARWGRVAVVEPRSAAVELAGEAPANELARRLELLVSPPRAARTRWLVEKATELGIFGVRFLGCARGQRSFGPAMLERLERVARAAVEQAHRARVPELSGPHPWSDLDSLLASCPERWMLDPGGSEAAPSPGAGAAALLVGPEGGWVPEERRDLEALGCGAWSLGPATLRVETAALAALARCRGARAL